jgi:hypothetical protein
MDDYDYPSLGPHQAKMLSGELYYAIAPELMVAREYTHKVLTQFNSTPSDQPAERRRLIRKLVPKAHLKAEREEEEPWIENPFKCDYVRPLPPPLSHAGDRYDLHMRRGAISSLEKRFLSTLDAR